MRSCEKCGSLFETVKPWQKFCSRICYSRKDRRSETKKFHEKRRRALDEIKLMIGCVECGYDGHPAALDWNHRPEKGPKLFDISANIKRSWAATLKEITKCNVLCANCHRIHTHEEKHFQTLRKDR